MPRVEVHGNSSLLFETLYDINKSIQRIDRRVARLESRDRNRVEDKKLILSLRERILVLERDVSKNGRYLQAVDKKTAFVNYAAVESSCNPASVDGHRQVSSQNISYEEAPRDIIELCEHGEGQARIGKGL